MRAFIDRLLTQIRELLAKMSTKSKIWLGFILVVVIIVAIVLVSILSRVNFVLLHNADNIAEVGAILDALDGMNVQYRTEGTRIYVPEGRVSDLRARLANQGVIGADEPDLSIMMGASGFGVTEAHQKKLYEAQKGEDIKGQLLRSPRIAKANVNVMFGEYSPFAQSTGVRDANAAVMLVIQDGGVLTKAEARTIAELVRTNVPGIKYENITISDSNLNYYPVREEITEAETVAPEIEINSRIAMQNLLRQRMRDQAEQILTPIYGVSNVQVAVTVRLNFDKKIIESVEFDPPVAGELDGIIRSSSDMWETQRRDGAAEGIPGTDPNGLGTVEYPYGTLDNGEQYGRMVSEKNYEINETRTLIEEEQGRIEFLSIGALINNAVLSEEDLPKVANILSRGFGISPENVAVERVSFDYEDMDLGGRYDSWFQLDAQTQRQELLRTIIMWAVILLLGIAVLVVIRMIVRSLRPPPEPAPVLAQGVAGGIDYIAGDDYDVEDEDVLDEIEDIELPKKSTGLEQIERFIDKDPVAVAALLRNWLSDE